MSNLPLTGGPELPEREPAANQERPPICAERGYCGPFINQEFYNAFPDPAWHGYGECVVCGSTRRVLVEEGQRAELEMDCEPEM